MRSENYALQQQTFTRFEVPHMVRAALVEGLRHNNPKNIEYRELIKQYIDLNPAAVNRLHRLMQHTRLTPDQVFERNELLNEFKPRGEDNHWKNLDYDHLKSENVNVIQTVSGNLEKIVSRSAQGKLWEVLELPTQIANGEIDYKKHIPRSNKILLDSEQTIQAFAAAKNMSLHAHWDGSMSGDLLRRLSAAGYSLVEAITTALTQNQSSPNKYAVISYTNYSTGDEVRFFPIDFIETPEYFAYMKRHSESKMEFELGDAEQKYAGSKTLIVPKRRPDEKFSFNKSTLEYLAEFRDSPLIDQTWWINFRAECDCVYSRERALFNIEIDQTRRKPIIFDPHIGGAFLTIFDILKIDARSYLPIPSKELFTIGDYIRFNMYEIGEGGNRKPIREEGINIMLLHYMKADPQGALSKPGTEKVSPYVLQPIHL